jgi:hypothetical protein
MYTKLLVTMQHGRIESRNKAKRMYCFSAMLSCSGSGIVYLKSFRRESGLMNFGVFYITCIGHFQSIKVCIVEIMPIITFLRVTFLQTRLPYISGH